MEGITFSELPIGTRMELEITKDGAELKLEVEIKELVAEGMLVAKIMSEGKTVGFSEDLHIKVYFAFEKKLYEWDNVKVMLVKYKGEVQHLIMPTSPAQTINRRKAFRLYIGEEMPIILNTAKGVEAETVLVKDVSETGIAFLSDKELENGLKIRIRLQTDSRILNLDANIVRNEEKPELRKILYGAKFIGSYPALSAYIMLRQRQKLKLGSIPEKAPDEAEKVRISKIAKRR